MKKQQQKGFTLIELMIVVAIIGILAAVALPAYQDYTVRAKLSEATGMAAAAKTAVTEYYQSNGDLPTSNTEAGIRTINSDYVDSIAVGAAGKITVDLTATAAGIGKALDEANDSIFFTPTENSGTLTWVCSTNIIEAERSILPSNCRTTGS